MMGPLSRPARSGQCSQAIRLQFGPRGVFLFSDLECASFEVALFSPEGAVLVLCGRPFGA